MIQINITKPFNLDNTVTCGQIFRYYKQEDGSYDIVLTDRVVNVLKKDDKLLITSNDESDLENIIRYYLDLDFDYEKIHKELLKKDEKLKTALDFSIGLNMIQQDHFETVMEYIISANNSVPSIANALNNIAKRFGKKIVFNSKEYYLFPKSIDLKNATINEYRECKVGFRDKYLYEFVKKINNNEIDLIAIEKMNTDLALEYLMKNSGIGPKIASCILLFSYKRYDVFPIDTWVKKIMKERYNIEGEKNIREFSKKTYGEYCGIAIQYLFNESRNNK